MTDHTAIQETDEMKQQWAKHIKQGASMTESHTTLYDVCQEILRLEAVQKELLEALKLAHATLCGANMNEKIVFKKITAAIAKATGEQA